MQTIYWLKIHVMQDIYLEKQMAKFGLLQIKSLLFQFINLKLKIMKEKWLLLMLMKLKFFCHVLYIYLRFKLRRSS